MQSGYEMNGLRTIEWLIEMHWFILSSLESLKSGLYNVAVVPDPEVLSDPLEPDGV